MSDHPIGPGWWMASDGRWYPPQDEAGALPPTAPWQPPGEPRGPSVPRRAWGRFRGLPTWAQVTAGVVVAGVLILSAASSPKKSTTASVATTSGTTATSAVTTPPPTPEDPVTAALLEALAPTCVEDPAELIRLAGRGANDLAKHGIVESQSGVLHDVWTVVHGLGFKTNCGQILAAYLVMREG